MLSSVEHEKNITSGPGRAHTLYMKIIFAQSFKRDVKDVAFFCHYSS